jgi:cytochrome c553
MAATANRDATQRRTIGSDFLDFQPAVCQTRRRTQAIQGALLSDVHASAGILGLNFRNPATTCPSASPATNASMCIGCHGIVGYWTAYPTVYHVPKIASQPSPLQTHR